MNRCGSFPLLSAPHSLFSISTDLKISEKIPGEPMRRWGVWILLTGPSGLHRNSFSNHSVISPTSQLILILQAFCHFTYITAHSPTLPLLYLRHNSFSNPSVASPTSQHILQPFFRLSYVTGFSLTSPGEPPMILNFVCAFIHIYFCVYI